MLSLLAIGSIRPSLPFAAAPAPVPGAMAVREEDWNRYRHGGAEDLPGAAQAGPTGTSFRGPSGGL